MQTPMGIYWVFYGITPLTSETWDVKGTYQRMKGQQNQYYILSQKRHFPETKLKNKY